MKGSFSLSRRRCCLLLPIRHHLAQQSTATADRFVAPRFNALDGKLMLAPTISLDSRGQGAKLLLTDQPGAGTAAVANGKINYFPDDGFVGTVVFTYSIPTTAPAPPPPTLLLLCPYPPSPPLLPLWRSPCSAECNGVCKPTKRCIRCCSGPPPPPLQES
jgi:hypothetical protein